MQVNKIQNNNYNPSFGTYLGINMQEKILLAKQRSSFSSKWHEVLLKLEDDGYEGVLEISDKYKITRVGKKSTMCRFKNLTLSDLHNSVVIDSLENVYRLTENKKNFYFNMTRFLEILDEKFNLAEKVKKGYEELKLKRS